jgi:hypothetical protein
LFSRGACYNRLGYFQKAIDDYYLALEKDSEKVLLRKQNYRNIGKVLGIATDVGGDDHHHRGSISATKLDHSKIMPEQLDPDIQHFVYSNVDIKNTIDSLSSSIQRRDSNNHKPSKSSLIASSKNVAINGPQEINLHEFVNTKNTKDDYNINNSSPTNKYDILKNNSKKDNFIQVKKVEFINDKFNEQIEDDVNNDEASNKFSVSQGGGSQGKKNSKK